MREVYKNEHSFLMILIDFGKVYFKFDEVI